MNTTTGFQALSALLKAAGDPLRLEILRALDTDSFGVLELCHIFEAKQSGMSHHLKVLAKAGLVTTRREGNSIFYRRNPVQLSDELYQVKSALVATLNDVPLSDSVLARSQEIYNSRSEAAKNFFTENSKQFRETQDMIAAFDVYGSQVRELLDSAQFSSQKLALEIGPGEGEFLAVLAEKFEQVTALDITPEMLDKAKARNRHLSNIDYICDDTHWCIKHPNKFDNIVINMVLHHTPSPRQIFADASTALKSNGVLLVCDLCRHEQDWVKTACGDLWQGFEPQELNTWAKENNLTEGQSIYFALRNGFQIQIQQFIKEQSIKDSHTEQN